MIRAVRPRAGFTLIEILIVVGIISVLVALLLPAVNKTREAARRTWCSSSLMQLAVALQLYQNAHGVLPSGVVNATGPVRNVPQGYHRGWIVQLLPYLEQSNVAARFDDVAGLYDSVNLTARSVVLQVLLCPSDGGSVRRPDGVVQSSYAACHHDLEAPISARDKGSFFLNSGVGYSDIPDGTSCTLFVGEKNRYPLDLGWASGTRATLRNTGYLLNAPDLLYGTQSLSGWTDDDAFAARLPLDPDPSDASLVGGFSSSHPGMVSFAFGDGSVRYLSNTTSSRILRSLANRSDGDVLREY
jgi:prepilin-type N-terminal cleavage/methylation domain-containing protein